MTGKTVHRVFRVRRVLSLCPGEILTHGTPRTQRTQKAQRGFSLLELMIAMFIMIILISVAVPTYERSVRHARETVLRENLWQMRRAIDQFTADKGKLPKDIDDLVTARYLHEKPVDPIKDSTEWQEILEDDIYSAEGGQGLKDVKSTAEGTDSEGTSYSNY